MIEAPTLLGRRSLIARGMAAGGVLAAGACLCCAPRRGFAAMRRAAFDEVAPGIHMRRGLTEDASATNDDAIANTGFVVGERSVAVFDPGGDLADGVALRQAVRAVTPLPISHVILSHVHPDHVFGAGAFLDDKPSFVGHARLPGAMARRAAFYAKGLDEIMGPGRAGPIVQPTKFVVDQDEIDLGNRVLLLTAHAPAHTDSDLSALDRRTGTLLTGDLLFVHRVPALDGDLAGWRTELDRLRALPARHAVPGHGPTLVAWPNAGADLARYLQVLQAGTRAAVAAGTPLQQATTTVAGDERERWAMFDDYNPRNVTEAYRQIEWE